MARGESAQAGMPLAGPAVVLSGSCSVMTDSQVAAYRQQAPARAVDLSACFTDLESYVRTLTDWVDAPARCAAGADDLCHHRAANAAADPGAVWRQGQQRTGGTAVCRSCRRPEGERIYPLIVAGGETSSIVAQTLGVEAFHIRPTISPGVPWVRDTRQPLSLALKSGNFGDIQFFARAQQEFRHD
ncbi:nucleotide-binding domain containing protein [Klebsiella pneumoniae]|uniref:nucleotide-binding domain containing protein n=1 Tax=Klebsiella pneumoniae TaxID=573 RepID=UPI003B678705